MMTSKDIHLQKWLDAFAKLNVSSERLDAIEAYLKGETSLETLEKFPFQDLTNASCPEFTAQMNNAMNRQRYEEAGRAFNAIFSVGQTTSVSLLKNTALSSLPGVEQEKIMAIHAEEAGSVSWRLQPGFIECNLIRPAKNPQALLKAAGYSKQNACNGRLILWACYFLMKYPDRDLKAEAQETSKGLLAGIGKIFSKKQPAVAEEDQKLLKQYEDTVLSNLSGVISCPDPTVVRELTDAVRENWLDAAVLQGAAKCMIQSDFLLDLVGGMAYLNFPLSEVLKNVVRILFAVDTEKTLNALRKVSHPFNTGKMDITVYGADFDRIFGFSAEKYIIWAAREHLADSILKAQLAANREAYLAVLDEASLEYNTVLMYVIQKNDPGLYESILKERSAQGADNQDRVKLIEAFVKGVTDPAAKSAVEDYLQGRQPASVLCSLGGKLGTPWGYGSLASQLETYGKNYKDSEFVGRCLVFKTFQRFFGSGSYFITSWISPGKIDEKRLRELFDSYDKEGVSLQYQADFVGAIRDDFYSDGRKKEFLEGVIPIFRKYLKERREEMVPAFQNAGAAGRYLGLLVYEENPEANREEILGFSQDGSKLVKDEFIKIVCGQKGWLEDVKGLLASKKGADREAAVQILACWDGGKGTYKEILQEALAKEKSAKIAALLEKALNMESSREGNSPAEALTLEERVKELHKGGKKRGLAWAYENRAPFPTVHKKDGSEATEEYLQAILLCYQSMNPCGVNATAKSLAQELNEGEFAGYVNELFERWMEGGAESKKRWVIYAASIHGGAAIVEKLKSKINEWPQNARGAIAGEAVQALALSPQPQALLFVDGVSRKFKFKQVKEAAGKALEYAASQLGLTTEELSDRIVPNLGFDENMERLFDYGERKFTVTITTALEIEILDESGKKVKSMPAPGKKDDEEKANAAYEEFKQLKKQMKATVTSQKTRLELALSSERQWTTQAWQDLFVKNPIMHQFAIGLIWGLYEDGRLKQSFRYMEDGSFNTEDEEEFAFPEEGRIGLVHPIELTKESLTTWKGQLEDYEITQPIEQLDREIFYVTEEEKKSKRMERYGGYVMNALSLQGKLQNFGWYRGSVQDAGGFDTFYREDAGAGLGAELHFSGTYVGVGYDEEVTVYDVRFYKAGTIQRGSYLYDEADDKKAIPLGEVPARYFSEIVLQLKKATASSQEREENWKKNAG